jgi:hypothetical protein
MLRTQDAYIYIFISYASQRLDMYSFCRFQISKSSDQIESNRNRFDKKSNQHRFDLEMTKTRPNRIIPRRSSIDEIIFSSRSSLINVALRVNYCMYFFLFLLYRIIIQKRDRSLTFSFLSNKTKSQNNVSFCIQMWAKHVLSQCSLNSRFQCSLFANLVD